MAVDETVSTSELAAARPSAGPAAAQMLWSGFAFDVGRVGRLRARPPRH